MPQPLTIVLVEKTGELKSLNVKDYKEEELFKKCGFKKADGFSKHAEWPVKFNGQKFSIMMYGKDDGKANMENKYDFPPPIDKTLLFGCCVLVGQIRDDTGQKSLINLSVELWTKLYTKLFGGFEELTAENDELDDDEDDELDDNEDDEDDELTQSKKTKNSGYLKDGFVIDDSSDTNDESDDFVDDDDDGDGIKNIKSKNIKSKNNKNNNNNKNSKSNTKNNTKDNTNDMDDELLFEDIGSELSEDSYDYE